MYIRLLTFISIIIVNLQATSLKNSIEQVINTNSEIITEHFNKKASRTDIDIQKANYNPTVDFNANIKNESITENKTNPTFTKETDFEGWNANIKLEQMLYDGGKTPNNIKQFRHKYNNIKYKSNDKIENLVLDTINIYTQLVSYQELIAIDNHKIKVHQRYLQLAKEKEEISGEILDVYLVNSKIKAIMDNYLEQEVNQQKAYSQYKKLTNNKLKGNICRPLINENIIPPTLDKAIDIALRNNNQILAQNELIKEQLTKINSQSSSFKPTVKFQMSADYDQDIKLEGKGKTTTYDIGIQSNWNLYNGGKDNLTTQKEKIILLEQKKILDTIVQSVITDVEDSYNSYFKLKQRIENLKSYILDNKAIVDIYNRQLSDGTKTFLDLLNAEAELFRTKVLLTDIEFLLFDEYYNILKNLDILSDSILMDKDQICAKYTFNEPILKLNNKNENELSDELGLN